MELYQLKSFIHVAKTCNLTRAAGTMNISLSALSSQIKALEDELSIPLFLRGPKGMQLTDKGYTLLKEAKKVVMAAKRFEQTACELEATVTGIINIGINTDPRFLEISDISSRVKGLFPKVNLSFIETQTFETVKMLQDEEIDVGYHYGEINEEFVHSTQLSTVEICIVLPQRLVKEFADADLETIAGLPWVWAKHGCPFHMALKADLDKRDIQLNQVTDAAAENIVRELVKSGTGVALMRKDEALDLVAQKSAAIWKGYKLDMPLGIACMDSRKKEPVISGFMAAIGEKQGTC
ncbi:MAG: LysR family transcriptional regulator [Desulfobacula sp.]|nr:LysR family transcriptional regulator [Desulfobacula sp.]